MKAKKKESKIKEFQFIDPIFRAAFHVVVGGGKKQAFLIIFSDDQGKREAQDLRDRIGGACTFSRRNNKLIGIWFSKTALDEGSIAHEAMHATKEVLEMSGVGALSDETEEIFAYYLQMLVNILTSLTRGRGVTLLKVKHEDPRCASKYACER